MSLTASAATELQNLSINLSDMAQAITADIGTTLVPQRQKQRFGTERSVKVQIPAIELYAYGQN